MILPALLLATIAQQPPVPDPEWGEDPHAPRGYRGFGTGLADLGDVNSDGFDDISISDLGSVPATIWIISGRNGQVIESLCSDDSSRTFGGSIAALPDVDGDGVGEILVGLAPPYWGECAPGRAAIYSGRTRILLRILDAPAGILGFGSKVAGMRDVDGDGAGDVLVKCKKDSGDGFGFVYSGGTGRLLYGIQAPAGVEARSIDPIGDVDLDGIADLAFVGLIARLQSPLLRLLSGADGHLIREVDTDITSSGVGLRTLPIEDVDRDGLADLLFCSRGVLQARSAADLRILRSFDTPNLRPFDTARGVTRVGDIDGDGGADIVLSNPDCGWFAGMDALSGRTGQVLWTLQIPSTWRNVDLYGVNEEVVAIRDVDKDGVREFLWTADNSGCSGPGLVFVSSGKTGNLLRVFARGPRLSVQCLVPKG